MKDSSHPFANGDSGHPLSWLLAMPAAPGRPPFVLLDRKRSEDRETTPISSIPFHCPCPLLLTFHHGASSMYSRGLDGICCSPCATRRLYYNRSSRRRATTHASVVSFVSSYASPCLAVPPFAGSYRGAGSVGIVLGEGGLAPRACWAIVLVTQPAVRAADTILSLSNYNSDR